LVFGMEGRLSSVGSFQDELGSLSFHNGVKKMSVEGLRNLPRKSSNVSIGHLETMKSNHRSSITPIGGTGLHPNIYQ